LPPPVLLHSPGIFFFSLGITTQPPLLLSPLTKSIQEAQVKIRFFFCGG
jgi:hypothetical protein